MFHFPTLTLSSLPNLLLHQESRVTKSLVSFPSISLHFPFAFPYCQHRLSLGGVRHELTLVHHETRISALLPILGINRNPTINLSSHYLFCQGVYLPPFFTVQHGFCLFVQESQ